MPLAHVEEIECQVTRERYGERPWPDHPKYGSRGCLYRIRWDSRGRPSRWKRIFQRYSVYRRAINDLQEANQALQEKYDEVRKLASELESPTEKLAGTMAELKVSVERYRLLADNVTDTIWTMSLEPLRFTYVSPSIMQMRGLTVEEAMAMSMEQTLAPESLDLVTKALAEELARETDGSADPNRSKIFEIQQYKKDGSLSWAEIRTSFLRTRRAGPWPVGDLRDISEPSGRALYQARSGRAVQCGEE
jgi:PAS domain S-box-containing protein